MSSTEIAVVVIGVLAVLAIAAAWFLLRRRSLRRRFGPEYDRVVAEQDSRRAAEQELRERERRHAELELHPLSDRARARYAAAWAEVQARFVDAPKEAVAAGDELVTRLIAERGYPTGDYDEQAAHLSVEHARTLGHYRAAHEIQVRNERGEAGTEELRQALVHYRALFADVLGEDPIDGPEHATPATGPGTSSPTGTTSATRTPTDTGHPADKADGATARNAHDGADGTHDSTTHDNATHDSTTPGGARTAPQDANRP